jgi:hypothetical protein
MLPLSTFQPSRFWVLVRAPKHFAFLTRGAFLACRLKRDACLPFVTSIRIMTEHFFRNERGLFILMDKVPGDGPRIKPAHHATTRPRRATP